MSSSRVILINPPADYDREAYKRFDISMAAGVPFGLLLLGSALERQGFSVTIIDGQVVDCEAVLAAELKAPPLFVGLSVMTSQTESARALSTQAKSFDPALPVVWGGFHSSILPKEVIALPFVDFIITGEADKALPQLCEALLGKRELRHVGNLVFRDGGEIVKNAPLPLTDFSSLPDLNWALLGDVEKYIKKTNVLGKPTRMLSLLVGLGCNFACTFCHNAIYRKAHRTKSAESIVAEMNRAHEEFGVTEFGLADENFFGDRDRIEAFLTLLENNGYRYLWSSTLRASYVSERYINRDLFERVARTGGYYFGVGAESGNDQVLKKLRKGIKSRKVLTLAEWTRGLPITMAYSFIAGIPGETCAMTLDTLRLIDQLKKVNRNSLIIGPQVFRPYPGSPLAEEAMGAYLDGSSEKLDNKTFYEMLSRFRKIDEEALPWHEDAYRFKYMLLSFFVLQLNRNKGVLANAAIALLQVVSIIRLKFGWYSGFFEKPVLDAINRRLS